MSPAGFWTNLRPLRFFENLAGLRYDVMDAWRVLRYGSWKKPCSEKAPRERNEKNVPVIDLRNYQAHGYSRGVPRWKELAWWLTRSLFFAPWFPVPSGLKAAALRAFGAKVGVGVVIRSRVNITMPWRLVIGDHVWIGDEVMILSLDEVRIGSHVCISQRAFLCTGSHDFSKESFDLVTRPIEIGESCWVGAQTFVGPGITMGRGSRCLAGSVVVKPVEAGETVGGVKAEKLRSGGSACFVLAEQDA